MKKEIATTLPAATPAQVANNDGKGWDERAITINYDLEEDKIVMTSTTPNPLLVKAFYVKQAVVYLQGNIRRWLKAGKTDAEIRELVSKLNLSDALKGRARKSASEKIADIFKGLSKEQKMAAMRVMKDQITPSADLSSPGTEPAT